MQQNLPKQYLTLHGKPLIHHALDPFIHHERITRTFVVLSPDDQHWLPPCSHKVEVWYCGGDSRAQSVLNGLLLMPAQAEDWVLVHDAARPCLTMTALERLLATLQHDRVGGLLAIPVADTLKRSDHEQQVESTINRNLLWQAQTPQMFRYGALLSALQTYTAVTDESQAMEAAGYHPKLVPGSRYNIKVTHPEDLKLAGLLLQHREAIA